MREKNIDPFPAQFLRTHTSLQSIREFERSEEESDIKVTVGGRITARRGMGKATFIDLRDAQGQIQLLVRKNNLGGDWLGATGSLFKTRTGEITVQVSSLQILCKAIRSLPEKWHGLTDVETRFRQRYLDLIANEQAVISARSRSKLISTMRQYMDNKGFMEVETPILVPIAAGGRAKPFTTHHNAMNRELHLRIATELHLKRLIVGGLEKVYEIGRVFRNEGLDQQHNPEFTTMESYEAFSDYNDVMVMVEELVSLLAGEITGSSKVSYGDDVLDFTPPWPRLNLREKIISESGIDFLQHEDIQSLKNAMHNIGIDASNQVSWGGLLDKLISDKVEPTLTQPCFLVDYPLAMSPLAKKSAHDNRIVERFEGFVSGMEICNAFTELNDPIDQRYRFEEQEELHKQFSTEDMDRLDEDFLIAVEHGMPPTGGLGMGIDRLAMILTNNQSIREVILFPQMRT